VVTPERVAYKEMTQLQLLLAELTYQGSYTKPAFSLFDTPGKLYDLLLDALEEFGSTSNDLAFEDGEPEERGVTCVVDDLDATVTVCGDRVEIKFTDFKSDLAKRAEMLLTKLWSGLTTLVSSTSPRMQSFTFDLHSEILQSSYQEVLEGFARRPQALPAGTESAVVFYLPSERGKGYGESSIVFNRSEVVERGLQVNAILTYEGDTLKPTTSFSTARKRLSELLRSLGLEYTED
jgi:hypothetical protein